MAFSVTLLGMPTDVKKARQRLPQPTRVAHTGKCDVCRCICGLQDAWVSMGEGSRYMVNPNG